MFQYVYVPFAVVALACTAFAAQAEAPLSLATTSLSSGCGTNLTPSCQNSSVETNSCCFEAPGGWISQVQFWDTNPSTGPLTNWTIHGLWPNNCDGSYSEDCDSSRDYSDITSLLQDQGASSTLDFMQTYWISDDESNEAFWEHEWSTHGTCYSTLNPSCLPSGSPTGAEAVAFFETAVNLFQSLPTYEWLEQAGITPGDSEYALSDLVSALQSAFGATPVFSCNDHNTIYQISYYFNLQGSMIDGQFDPVDAPSSSSCDSQVMYPAKTN
ncbi:ribonuclease T2-like protein [Sparassis latifolia]